MNHSVARRYTGSAVNLGALCYQTNYVTLGFEDPPTLPTAVSEASLLPHTLLPIWTQINARDGRFHNPVPALAILTCLAGFEPQTAICSIDNPYLVRHSPPDGCPIDLLLIGFICARACYCCTTNNTNTRSGCGHENWCPG